MPNVMTCPSEHDLQQLLLGQIPDADAEPLEEHLSQCERCLQTASTLKLEDTLAEAVRAQAAVPELSTGELVTGLMERLEKLRPAQQTDATTIAADDTPPEKKTQAPPTPPTDATQVIYQFLAPPETPEELGRLGQYRIRRVLGTGGMGVVFEALDPHLGRLVALKAMLPALASNPSAHERFMREAKAVAAIEHDHIIAIHQVSEEGGVPYLAMPLLKGETLEERLKREPRLPLPLLLQIGRETAEGLAAAHACGLIHRDIKPANLWLELKEGETVTDPLTPVVDKPIKRVKILDFGLARAAGDTQLTQLGAIVGTPAFMAPEQTRAGGVVDHRADLFSLGCVLYRAATGDLPFKGGDTMSILAALALDTPPSPHALNPQIPAALSDLIMQLLAKKPDDRPASAQELVERMKAVEENPGAGGQISGSGRRGRGWIAVAAAALFGALAFAAYQVGPTVYRFVTKQGEIVITADAPVQVTVKQNGKEIRIVDTETKQELILDAGDYEVELPKGTARPMYASPQKFTLQRGGRQIVEVTFNPSGGTATSAKGSTTTRVTTIAATMAKTMTVPAPTGARFRNKWDMLSLGRPTGDPLTQDGVTKEGDGWRIESTEPRTVRLFEVPDPGVEDCMVIFRALMKSSGLKGQAYLEMLCRYEGQEFFSKDLEHPIRGTTGWSTYETPFFLKKGERPDLLKLNLVIKGTGTVWIKDLTLLRRPPAADQGDEPAGNLFKSRRPLSTSDPRQEDVRFDGESWRIEAIGPRSVQLREAPKPKVFDAPALLVYRAAMKTSNLKGRAYLELVCDFPGKGEFFSKGAHNALEGTTDWTTVSTEFRLRYGERPERFKLRVVIEGQGTVWVKNPELEVMHPLNADKADFPGVPRADAESTGRPTPKGKGGRGGRGMIMAEFLAKAVPVEGESYGVIPAQLGVTPLGDSWRIDVDGKRTVEIYEINKPKIPGDGPVSLVYRADMKTENLTGRTFLEIAGQDLPSQETSVDPVNKSTTDWTPCITSYQLKKDQRPGWIKLRVVVDGKGTVWVKNPKLLAMPIPSSDTADEGSTREPGDQRLRSGQASTAVGEIRDFTGHAGPVTAVRFSPDGKRVYSCGKDGVRAWSAATGRLIWKMEGWTALDMDVSRDGHQVLVGLVTFNALGNDCGSTKLLDAASGKELRRLQVGQDGGCGSVAFVGDGSRFVARVSKHAFVLVETDTDVEIARFGSPEGTIDHIAVSPDGTWAVTAGDRSGSMRLWNLKRPEEKSGFEQEHKGAIKALAYSPDGKRVLSGGADGTVRLWEVSRGRQIHSFQKGSKASVNSVVFSPDGRFALSGGDDGTAHVWQLSTGQEVDRLRAFSAAVLSVAFSPDGRSALASSADGSVRLWRLPPNVMVLSD
jgi:WD40 repeat protein